MSNIVGEIINWTETIVGTGVVGLGLGKLIDWRNASALAATRQRVQEERELIRKQVLEKYKRLKIIDDDELITPPSQPGPTTPAAMLKKNAL